MQITTLVTSLSKKIQVMKSVNPYNGQLLKEFKEYSKVEVNNIIEKADNAFKEWKKTDFDHRAQLMHNCAAELRENKRHYAEIMTLEMGKLITEATAEIEKCALACDYYANNAAKFLSNEPLEVEKGESYIAYDPLGVILAVMPWNFPYWQVFRFAAPTIMAGNVGVLKHASNVPQCALAIEEAFRKAGFPTGVFSTLLIGSDRVNDVIDDERIKAVTLTGSEKAGSKIGERAGSNIKKTVLELGGSDPFIVLKDADLEEAATVAVKSRMINCGQSCIAAKRFIVEVSVAEEFIDKFKAKMAALKPGDPFDESTGFSAMAREDLVVDLLDQVKESVKKGATLVLGGDRPDREGAFLNPTIIANVKPGMPAHDEELFGPVATIFIVDNADEAVAVANRSRYGLGGSIWTRDIEKGQELARKVESGAVYINQMMASNPSVPFGGVKKSGYGRELSHLGIREFVNQKTIWINGKSKKGVE